MGDDPTIDGVEHVKSPSSPGVSGAPKNTRTLVSAVRIYYGKSKKGIVPFNPNKTNQDRMFMLTEESTNSVIFGVMDGHGEYGHLVSNVFILLILLLNSLYNSNYLKYYIIIHHGKLMFALL